MPQDAPQQPSTYTVEPCQSWVDALRENLGKCDRIALEVRGSNRAAWAIVSHWRVEPFDVTKDDEDQVVVEESLIAVEPWGTVTPYELAAELKQVGLKELDRRRNEKTNETYRQLYTQIRGLRQEDKKLEEVFVASDLLTHHDIPPGQRGTSVHHDPAVAILVDSNHFWRQQALDSRSREREEYRRRRQADDRMRDLVFDKGVEIFDRFLGAVGNFDSKLAEARKAHSEDRSEADAFMDMVSPWVPELIGQHTGKAMPGINCPGCNTACPRSAKFCHRCGSNLAAECGGCGAEVTTADKFCGDCGQQL